MRITVPAYHLLLVVIGLLMETVRAIQIYEVGVPAAVRAGENVLLACHYDMQGDVLYSIKWYKGRREFYRYTLKENPAKKVFKVAGMNVDQTRSNASHVLLTSVVAANSGKYGCEASADAPSFHTQIMFKEMTVVEIPDRGPTIGGLKERYEDGELLRANCTSRDSRPAANLTWTMNDQKIPPSQIYQVKPEQTNLHTTTAGIHFVVSNRQHYVQGKLKLKCTASIHDVYSQAVERVLLDGDSVLSAQESSVSSASSNSYNGQENSYSSNNSLYNIPDHNTNNNNVNMFQSSDPYSMHDFEIYGGGRQENKKEAYMTPIQADMSSATKFASLPICTLLLMITFQLWTSRGREISAALPPS